MDQESFDRLLRWLGPDREASEKKYLDIRFRLIRILARWGCYEAEDLADEAFDRVAKKLPEIEKNYVGEPALYFYGVARKVFHEWLRRPKPVLPPSPDPDPGDLLELYDNCLTTCLDDLSQSDRKLILDYFKEEGRAKIDAHNAMAKELGININALRTRAHRIKKTLKECVFKCIRRNKD